MSIFDLQRIGKRLLCKKTERTQCVWALSVLHFCEDERG